MPQAFPSGRSRPFCLRNPFSTRSVLGAATLALFAGILHSGATRADIWGYVDDSGRSHLASEKLDDRYSLFFKGGVRVDASGTPVGTPAPLSSEATVAEIPTAPQSVVAAKQLPAAVARFEPLINQYAQMHHVDPALVKAVVAAESAFQPGVVSAKGALGLMQIIPDTGERYGVTGDRKKSVAQKLFDPATNIKVGTRYLRDLLGMFAQNIELALAAYNAGEGAVLKYNNQVPPYAETREYVKKVQKLYADFKPAPAPTRASAQPAAAKARLLLPGQRVPVAGLVPVAADLSTAVFPSALPAATVSTSVDPQS